MTDKRPGQSDKPAGTYTTELFADDIARFMDAIQVERAHVTGLSLGQPLACGWRPNTRRRS